MSSNLLFLVHKDIQIDDAISKTELYLRGVENKKAICNELISARSSNDISNILGHEKLLLRMEKENRITSSDQLSSVNKGLERVQDAERAIIALNSGHYAGLCMGLASKDYDSEGLPLDGFRKFVKSQSISLTNRKKADSEAEKKEILTERINNLKHAESMYKALQRAEITRIKKV